MPPITRLCQHWVAQELLLYMFVRRLRCTGLCVSVCGVVFIDSVGVLVEG